MKDHLKTESGKTSNRYKILIVVVCLGTCAGLFYLFMTNKFFYLKLEDFKNMLESSIDFLSIIIVFYSAFIGIVIAVKEDVSFKELDRTTIKKFMLFAICVSFVALILSFLLQILFCIRGLWFLVYLWIIFFILSITCSFLTILLTLHSVFGDNSIPKEKEKI